MGKELSGRRLNDFSWEKKKKRPKKKLSLKNSEGARKGVTRRDTPVAEDLPVQRELPAERANIVKKTQIKRGWRRS